MVDSILIYQTHSFKKAVKKLKSNQKADLDKAIKLIIENPKAGNQKKGDLDYLRVFKFKMIKQEMLLGYSYIEEKLVLELLMLATHEYFYRDIKR